MKLFFVLSFFACFSVFAQDRVSNTLSTSTPTATGAGVEQSNPGLQCCGHQAQKVCQVKFVTGGCPGSWTPVANIKKCLAAVPGYNFSQPAAGQINMNQAYVINPCP